MESRSSSEMIAQHVQNGHLGNIAGEPTKEWHLSPEVPLAHELMAHHPPALPEVDTMKPMPKEEYLEAQYRLHRYEATEMLRRAIMQYRQDPYMAEGEDAFIYTRVHIAGYSLGKRGPACRITFSTSPPQPDKAGNQSDRLTQGSLVALTPQSDNFQSQCFVATVATRLVVDDTTSPVTEIFWADENHAVIDPTLEFVMLEPKGGYFEPIRYTMVGLQHAAFFQSRFDKYIFQTDENRKSCKLAAYVRETSANSAVVPSNAKHLDPSQLDALKQSTSRELAIVQGPPGTGKTFTSIVAIESYVKTLGLCYKNSTVDSGRPPPPVIIAAQTNHAVDQLLDRCIALRIGKIVRLGGGSQDEAINEYSMFNIRKNSRACRPDAKAEASHKALARYLRQSIQNCFLGGLLEAQNMYDNGIVTGAQYNSLVEDDWETEEPAGEAQSAVAKWLDLYVPQRDSQKAQPNKPQEVSRSHYGADKDRDFLAIDMSRPASILQAMQRGDGDGWSHKAERLLARNSNLYHIKPTERGAVYCYLYKKMFAIVTAEVRQTLGQFTKSCEKLNMARLHNNIKAIHAGGVQILGCTTTGLVKYRGLLAALKPRILLIEEAAEAREGNIAAALFPSLEQLVLVGDHQQLVPSVDVQELCLDPHRLNISLFERLVNIKVPYCALRVQRRMIPCLREVVQVFYPNLEDHAIVKVPECRPPVPGMGGRHLWWFQHKWTQSRGVNGTSYSNLKEADMIVGFARYLVQNGVSPDRITILTYYSGQVGLIKSRLRRSSFPVTSDFEWSVRTIDGFQGEENDIIILSLVRGPNSHGGRAMPGFVADENRAVVATSRAKCGFYIFGNAESVLNGNDRSRKTWQKVFDAFGERTDGILPITCGTHGNVTNISQPDDWLGVSAGGCRSQCNVKFPNGHVCAAACHPPGHGHAICEDSCPSHDTTRFTRYRTTDDLMELGVRDFFARREPYKSNVSDSGSDEEFLISFTPTKAKTPPRQRADGWDPDNVLQKDRAFSQADARQTDRISTSPRIHRRFRKATVDESGLRKIELTAESDDIF